MVSGVLVNPGSNNVMALNSRQAFTWTNAVLLTIEPLITNTGEIWIKKQTFIQENAFENVNHFVQASMAHSHKTLRHHSKSCAISV